MEIRRAGVQVACTPETSPELAQHVWDPVTGPSWAPTTSLMPITPLSLLPWRRGAPWTTLWLSSPHSLGAWQKSQLRSCASAHPRPAVHPCESPENTREMDTQAAGGPTVWAWSR